MSRQRPFAVVEEPAPEQRRPSHEPDKPQIKPFDDPLSTALGCKLYFGDRTFDWAIHWVTQGSQDGPGKQIAYEKYRFTRWYREINVLVDIIPRFDVKIRKSIADKVVLIRKYNEEHPKEPFGYLPVLTSFPILPHIIKALVNEHAVFDLEVPPEQQKVENEFLVKTVF